MDGSGSAKNEFKSGILPISPISENTPESTATSTSSWKNPFEFLRPPLASRVKQVWAVGGGKGGVGKSLIASSVALSLSRSGSHVVAMDLDLGGANLHTTLG